MDMNNAQQEYALAYGKVDILYVHTPAWNNWLYRVPYLAS